MEARNHLHRSVLIVCWLRGFIEKTLHGLTRGVVILSTSWAVVIGLQKNQDVADALIVADSEDPVVFTVVRDASCVMSGN